MVMVMVMMMMSLMLEGEEGVVLNFSNLFSLNKGTQLRDEGPVVFVPASDVIKVSYLIPLIRPTP